MIRYVNKERKRTLEVTEDELGNYWRTEYKEYRNPTTTFIERGNFEYKEDKDKYIIRKMGANYETFRN